MEEQGGLAYNCSATMSGHRSGRPGPAWAAGEGGETRPAAKSTELKALSGFGQEILGSRDQLDLSWRLVEHLVQRLAYPQAAFALLDDTRRLLFLAGAGATFDSPELWQGEPVDRTVDLGSGPVGRAGELARTERVDDLSAEPATSLAWLPRQGSQLAVPIVRQGQVLGVVSVFSSDVGVFSAAEAKQLEHLAPLIGVALQNAQALSQLNQQNRQLRLVADVSRIAVGAPDVSDLANRVAAKLLEEFDASWVGLSALDPARQTLTLRGVSQTASVPPAPREEWAAGEALPGFVMESGCTRVWSAEVEPNRGDALLESSESEICVPLDSAGKTIGVLHLVSNRRGWFGPDDAQVLEAVAGPVAHALASVTALTRITKLRNDLTGMIVHDVRNPLMIILTALKVLERVPTVTEDERAMRYLRSASAAGDDVMRLVGSLLDIQKLEAGELSLHPVTFPIGSLVRRIVESNRIVAEVEQVTLRIEIDEQTPAICCDMDLMRRVVENLIGNAIKFTPNGGEVVVNVSPAPSELVAERAPDLGSAVLVQVQDSGEGIPPEQHERIFEKFGVVESRRRRFKSSTGLGLALCKLVISAHGGGIWVDSTVGQGSCFSFLVPAAARSLSS